jgi:hypothetical protein
MTKSQCYSILWFSKHVLNIHRRICMPKAPFSSVCFDLHPSQVVCSLSKFEWRVQCDKRLHVWQLKSRKVDTCAVELEPLNYFWQELWLTYSIAFPISRFDDRQRETARIVILSYFDDVVHCQLFHHHAPLQSGYKGCRDKAIVSLLVGYIKCCQSWTSEAKLVGRLNRPVSIQFLPVRSSTVFHRASPLSLFLSTLSLSIILIYFLSHLDYLTVCESRERIWRCDCQRK